MKEFKGGESDTFQITLCLEKKEIQLIARGILLSSRGLYRREAELGPKLNPVRFQG